MRRLWTKSQQGSEWQTTRCVSLCRSVPCVGTYWHAAQNDVACRVYAHIQAQGFYIGSVQECAAVRDVFNISVNWGKASHISKSLHKRKRLVLNDLPKIAQQKLSTGTAELFRFIDLELGGLLSRWDLAPYDPQLIKCINDGSLQKIHSDTNYNGITKDGLRSLLADEVGVSGRGREFSLFVTGAEGGRFCIYLPIDPNEQWFAYSERLTKKRPRPELTGSRLYGVNMPPFSFCVLFAGALHAGSDALAVRMFAFLRRKGRTRRCASAYEQKTHYISEINQPTVTRSVDLPDVSERT